MYSSQFSEVQTITRNKIHGNVADLNGEMWYATGLYHPYPVEDTADKFCGTFYYYSEPGSKTCATYFNKTDAMMKLTSKIINPSYNIKRHLRGDYPADLRMSPFEHMRVVQHVVFIQFSGSGFLQTSDLLSPHHKIYVGKGPLGIKIFVGPLGKTIWTLLYGWITSGRHRSFRCLLYLVWDLNL